MNKGVAIAILCASTALVAGCGKRVPAGQVAATVNGKEVTLQEINTELKAANVPPNADKQQVQRALLQQVIDRKLLVAAAEDKGIDKSPEFIAQKRRADELLLAQAYAKQQLSAVPVPSPAEVDKFIADHPNVFGSRERLDINQLRFARPDNPRMLQALKDDHTLDAVKARLTSLGIRYDEGKTTIDTAQLPTNIVQQINKLPAGEPFVVPAPQGISINVIVGRSPIVVPTDKSRQAATAEWRQQKFGEILKSQLDALKSGAKISYQNGFGPPTAPGAATPTTGKGPAPASPTGAAPAPAAR